MDKMKNISKAEVLVLKDQVAYQEGQVVSKTLVQNELIGMTIFSVMCIRSIAPINSLTEVDEIK